MPLSDAGAFNALMMSRVDGCDGLRLARPALVPEVRLHLAEDAIVLQARLEAQTGRRLAAPFWARFSAARRARRSARRRAAAAARRR